jgi:signal transduction histidine kinase
MTRGGGAATQGRPEKIRRTVSLRARVALGVALPLLIALSAFSYVNFLRERRLLEAQLRSTASQLGSVMTGGLRQAMLVNDRTLISGVLEDIAGMGTIERVRVLDSGAVVRFDTGHEEVGVGLQPSTAPGCVECHTHEPASRPRAVLLSSPAGTLRIATPIDNETACSGCHTTAAPHLGVLLADVPLQALEAGLVRDLTSDLGLSVAVSTAVSLGVYLLVHWLIVRRLEDMQSPLATYAAGDFEVRLPVESRPDEIGRLSIAFNTMADQLERSARAERERRVLREHAAYEERERIARELHDGLAQILGYVSTKVMAIRILLTNRRRAQALEHLTQLEEASREVLIDVRQAILGLRLTSRPDVDLPTKLRDFASQFNRLSGVPVRVDIPVEAAGIHLTAEAEVELLRIVQEALTNIRKHASAHSAWLRLDRVAGGLELTVADDGEGFDPRLRTTPEADHFGLESMRQRAQSIGADLRVDSHPGEGTKVIVWIAPMEDA